MSRSHPISIGSIGSIGLCPLISGKSTPRDVYSMSSYSIDYDNSTNHTNTNFSDATLKPYESVYGAELYSNAHSSASKAPSKVTRFSSIVKTYSPCNQARMDSNNPYKFHSKITDNYSSYESVLLNSSHPIKVNSNNKININGNRGILVNKSEILKWKGSIPLESYPINIDPNPQVIIKKDSKKIDYTQSIRIKYLKPPSPPAPGDLIIRQEPSRLTVPAPPIIIRQQPPKPSNPPPLIIREAPPDPPPYIPPRVIKCSGKMLPPPPRKVIIERLPPVPEKPQPIIIERWLPYNRNVKRRVIFQKQPDPIYVKPKNIIVEWEPPEVHVKKDYEHHGVVKADPCEYIQKYGNTLKETKDLPKFAHDCKPPKGLVLATSHKNSSNSTKHKIVYELVGDVDALKLIDLDSVGLSEYKSLLKSQSKLNCSNHTSSSSLNKKNASLAVSSSSSICKNPLKTSCSSHRLCSSKSKTCLTYRQC